MMVSRPRLVGVLNGARVVSAIIVVFHHIGALDEDLWDPNLLASQQAALGLRSTRNRRLQTSLDTGGSGFAEFFFYIISFGPGHLAVEVFLALAGFVAAHDVWCQLRSRVEREDASEKPGEQDDPSQIGKVLFTRYQKALLGRFWRLALPLVPVQVMHLVLWSQFLAYGPYLSFSSHDRVMGGYKVGLRGIWSSSLSGSLWILEALFLAPFVALAIQLPVQSAPPRGRAVWYLLVVLYLCGSFVDVNNYSYFTGVVLGVALADVYNNYEFANPLRAALLLVACTMVSMPWWPGQFYGQYICLTVSATGFLFFILYAPRFLQRLLDNYLMEKLAPYSYQLYIWHVLVFSIYAVNAQPYAPKAVLYIFGFLSAFCLAVPAYHFIEIPSARFGKSFARWILDSSRNNSRAAPGGSPTNSALERDIEDQPQPQQRSPAHRGFHLVRGFSSSMKGNEETSTQVA
mmetsp:Transcript_2501/g.5747  ORF Transcript_2501/g.5747 Transcript_2501/m.5747 type:complete len:459 (-) Transcript_2501:1729-3105(-)